MVIRGPYGVGLWKLIHLGWDTFFNFFHFAIGRGTHVYFWHET